MKREPKKISGKTRGQMGALLKQNGNGRGLELRRKWLFQTGIKRDATHQDVLAELARNHNDRRFYFPSTYEMVEQILNSMYGVAA